MSKENVPEKMLALGNLQVIGEESEDDDREDEIKELLARAFSIETIGDDDEGGNDSMDDDHGDVDDTDSARGGQKADDLNPDGGGGGDDNRAHTHIREPVSLFHGSHCPKTGAGDRNGNFEGTWGSGDGETLQELKTLAEFRERQIQRAEERIELLSKEKRALAHQLALLKTETFGMKSTEEELRKTISLKEEQNEFFKEKVTEVLRKFETAKKSESETKDHNIRLQAQIEKLQQEAQLLSAIGFSTKESELNDALRQTRQKHMTEINTWREKVTQLELTIQKQEQQLLAQHKQKSVPDKRTTEPDAQTPFDLLQANDALRQIRQKHVTEINSWREQVTKLEVTIQNQEQLLSQAQYRQKAGPEKITLEAEAQTTFDLQQEVNTEKERHRAEKELWMKHLASLEGRVQELIMRRQDVRSVQVQAEHRPVTPTKAVTLHRTSAIVQTDDLVAFAPTTPHVTSIEVQTEETMETYRILGSLIESWVQEVTDSEARAVKAETEVTELTKGLRILKSRYRMLKKIVKLCRAEWNVRERAIVQRWNASEERFRNFMEAVGARNATLEKVMASGS